MRISPPPRDGATHQRSPCHLRDQAEPPQRLRQAARPLSRERLGNRCGGSSRAKPGSKDHLLIDLTGLPLAVGLSAANTHDSSSWSPWWTRSRIARSSVKQRARQAWLQGPVRKRSASMRVKLWPGPSRRIGWPACHEEAAVADSGSRSIAPTRKQRAPSAVKALAAARSTTPPVAGTT